MDLRKLDYNFLLYDAENGAAQHWSPHSSYSANYRHEQNGNPGGEGEYSTRAARRIYIDVVARMQSSGHAGQGSGNGVGPQFESIGIHAQLGRRILVLLDRAQCQAKSAPGNPG